MDTPIHKCTVWLVLDLAAALALLVVVQCVV